MDNVNAEQMSVGNYGTAVCMLIGRAACAGTCEQAPADGILDLSMRLTVGFAQRFHRRPLPAAFAVWRQLVLQRRNCMCAPLSEPRISPASAM